MKAETLKAWQYVQQTTSFNTITHCHNDPHSSHSFHTHSLLTDSPWASPNQSVANCSSCWTIITFKNKHSPSKPPGHNQFQPNTTQSEPRLIARWLPAPDLIIVSLPISVGFRLNLHLIEGNITDSDDRLWLLLLHLPLISIQQKAKLMVVLNSSLLPSRW